MPMIIQWQHPEGYVSPEAYLCITEITLRTQNTEVIAEVGIWENTRAYEIKSQPLDQYTLHVALDDLDLDADEMTLMDLQNALMESLKHKYNVKEEKGNESHG